MHQILEVHLFKRDLNVGAFRLLRGWGSFATFKGQIMLTSRLERLCDPIFPFAREYKITQSDLHLSFHVITK